MKENKLILIYLQGQYIKFFSLSLDNIVEFCSQKFDIYNYLICCGLIQSLVEILPFFGFWVW